MKKEKQDILEVYGIVQRALGNGRFEVELEESKKKMFAYIAGKTKHFSIKIMRGERVKIEVSIHGENLGRIVRRCTLTK